MRDPSRSPRRPRSAATQEVVPMDPVALTLAVWLGLIACVTGVIRLSENVAAQAAVARQAGSSLTVEMARGFNFGG